MIVFSGGQHPEPTVYICNALAYLCESFRALLDTKDIESGSPPDVPDIAWVVESAKLLVKRGEEDDEAEEDEEMQEMSGLTIQVM